MLPEQKAAGRSQVQSDETLRRLDLYPASADDAVYVSAEKDVVSLFDIWHILTQYKWMIVAIVVLSTLAAVTAGLLMTPVYRAEVLIAPVADSDDKARYASKLGEFGGIAALAGISLGRSGRRIEAIALLQSRILTEQMIKDEKLLPVLFHELWDVENQRWNVDDPDKAPTLEDAWELFDEKIRRVNEDRKTGLVKLTIEWVDPVVAARWGNELVSRVNAMLRRKASEESENAIRYLQDQLKQTSVVELQQVLHRMVEAEMKEVILANINEEFAFKVIDPAVAPEKAYKPVLAPMVTLGAFLGVLTGVICALFLHFLRVSRETPSDAIRE